MNRSLANVTVVGIDDIPEHFVRQFAAIGVADQRKFGAGWTLEFYRVR